MREKIRRILVHNNINYEDFLDEIRQYVLRPVCQNKDSFKLAILLHFYEFFIRDKWECHSSVISKD